jgi:hypothetical protein
MSFDELFMLQRSVETISISNFHSTFSVIIPANGSFDLFYSIRVLIAWPHEFVYYSFSADEFSILKTISLHIVDDL